MGLIAFLATASTTLITNFNQRQAINIAYDDVQTALAQAKSYALSQVVTDNCNVSIDQAERSAGITTTDELVGYEVRFDTSTNPNSYAVYEVCYIQGDPTRVKYTDSLGDPIKPVSEYELPKDIFFKMVNPPNPPAPVRFKVLTGGATSNQIITIQTENLDQVRAISVDTNGVIKDVSP